MDDIFFSRKKNNGESADNTGGDDRITGLSDYFSSKSSDDNEFKTDTGSVFSSGYTPSSSNSNDIFTYPVSDRINDLSQIKKEISERDRIPEELRDTNPLFSDSDDDYFAGKYLNRNGNYSNNYDNNYGSNYGNNYGTDTNTQSLSNDDEQLNARPVKKKHKMKKGKKVFISILLIILILFGSTGAYAFSIIGKLNYDTAGLEPNEYISSDKLMRDSNVKNILFIGCDDANGAQYSRSDTMMLVSIDKTNKAIKLTSFLRDSYLYIPGRDCRAKINSACTFGGPQFVVDALEYNFEVDIEHYVMVDFKMFINIVNALGGIDVEIEEDEADFLNRNCSNFKGKAKTGYNHLNGLQALDYCRIRKLDSDFYRTQRQRKVISEIIKKIKSFNAFNLFGQLDTILQYVETDISKNELISLGIGALTSYLKYDIMQERMPYGECGDSWYYDYTSGGESIIAVDVEANTEHIQNFIYKTTPIM